MRYSFQFCGKSFLYDVPIDYDRDAVFALRDEYTQPCVDVFKPVQRLVVCCMFHTVPTQGPEMKHILNQHSCTFPEVKEFIFRNKWRFGDINIEEDGEEQPAWGLVNKPLFSADRYLLQEI